jgi:hypothetical protein
VKRRILLAAIVLWVPLAAGAADTPLGRLFFTPEQRAALEDARRRNIRAEELSAQVASKPKAPAARQVVVNGLIIRNDGQSTVWVNGKPVERETADGMRVSPTTSRETVVLRDPQKGRTVRLKVGQHVDLQTGRIEENFEARRAAAREEEAAAEPDMPPALEGKPSTRGTRRERPADEREPEAQASVAVPIESGDSK